MNKKSWREYRFLLSAGVVIFTTFFAFGYSLVYYSKFRDFLNSGFCTAMAGAIAGSGVILFIDWCRRQDELLKDINLSIATLSNLIGLMLAIKSQNVLPAKQQYEGNLAVVMAAAETKVHSPGKIEIVLKNDFRKFMSPNLEVDIPLERLKSLVSHLPAVVSPVLQVKYYLAHFNQMHTRLMELYSEMEDMAEEDVLSFCYLFKRANRKSDTTFRDVLNGLALHTDDVLWFSDESIKLIAVAGKRALPFWLKSKIVRHELVDDYKTLMPVDSPYKTKNP